MRVGIIGCGGQGRIHADAYAQSPNVQIVGCCDVVPEKAEQLASQYGAKAFTDFREMLTSLRPDIVSVCTLEGQHADATIAALQAGAHVLCEKMLAASLDEARAMVQTARQVGRLLATQFNYSPHPFGALAQKVAGRWHLGRAVTRYLADTRLLSPSRG